MLMIVGKRGNSVKFTGERRLFTGEERNRLARHVCCVARPASRLVAVEMAQRAHEDVVPFRVPCVPGLERSGTHRVGSTNRSGPSQVR
jgi:hypothetical protein